MSFENDIAKLNEHFFFQEFTFSKNQFSPIPGSEVELADNLIWLDEMTIVFQLKERNVSGDSTVEAERKWFEKKVLGVATRQIRDTLTYLNSSHQIDVENHRGHRFLLISSNVSTVHKVVCYATVHELPDECSRKKFHISSTAGVIHLFSAHDYLGIVQTLLTPSELSEYLDFREELINRWGTDCESVPEQALVGQYLDGNSESPPSIDYLEHLNSLSARADEWDMSGIIKNFPDRITTDNQPTEYYSIVAEMAKLKRNELRHFKLRFQLAMEKSREGKFALPYRMASLRTGCAFVFIPLDSEMAAQRQQGLVNLTIGCKYDLKMNKCIGVSFAPEDGGWYIVEWCFLESEWQPDAEIERWLKESNPFSPVNTEVIERYDYHDS